MTRDPARLQSIMAFLREGHEKGADRVVGSMLAFIVVGIWWQLRQRRKRIRAQIERIMKGLK